MKTNDEIIKLLPIKEILVKGSNYIQYIDLNGNFCEVEKDYWRGKWFKFHTTGKSDSPIETFEYFID